MLLQLVFAVFLIFEFSETVLWNPCPSLRSTFQDIYIDSHGRKRPNCVCKNDLFGDQCQFKVYVGFDGKQNGVKENSRQPERSIYPFEYLNLKYYPNRSLVMSWRHAKIAVVQYYVIQFRELTDHNDLPWRTLAYIRSEYFNNPELMSFELRDFYNYTMYEMNLGIFGNDNVIVSVSVLHDVWHAESYQDVLLYNVMFSAAITWSAWSGWGSCETQHGCGIGKQKRSRVLVTNHCLSNKSEETRPCKLRSCPEAISIQDQHRTVPNNKQFSSYAVLGCNPMNGAWSVWSLWSQCSVTCDNGTRSRIRSCTSPAPRHGGEMCHGIRHVNETCINEACAEISAIATWSPLEKLKGLEFTSVVLGAAIGFVACLLITACPHLLKRCTRSLREKFKSLQDKELKFEKIPKLPVLQFTQEQTPLRPPLPPPIPPPPPAMNWRPVPHVLASSRQPTTQDAWRRRPMEMANNLFMEELLKAFKTFNFDSNKQFGNSSDKQPP